MTGSAVVVFDLDDTLYLEREFVLSGFAAVGDRVRAKLGIHDFGARAEAAFARGERTRVFDSVFAELGYPDDSALIDDAVATYRAHCPVIALAPDAARYLGRCPHRLSLLSDGHAATQRNKVDALGLDEKIVAPIVLTGIWGRDYWKPHPRGFKHLMAWHALPPERFVYVADNPGKDFDAPLALGWRTIQIARPGRIHAHGPVTASAQQVITTLDDLDDCLTGMAVQPCA